MPIYAYRCPSCGSEIEELRSLRDETPPPTHCGGETVRIISAASFGFRTAGGNVYGFSPSHGPVTKGNRKPKTIYRSDLGGRRAKPKIRPGADGKVVIE